MNCSIRKRKLYCRDILWYDKQLKLWNVMYWYIVFVTKYQIVYIVWWSWCKNQYTLYVLEFTNFTCVMSHQFHSETYTILNFWQTKTFYFHKSVQLLFEMFPSLVDKKCYHYNHYLTLSGRLHSNQLTKIKENTRIMIQIEEEFENTKGVIRIRKSKKDKQHNGQKDKEQKTKDRAIRTPVKPNSELRCSGRVSHSCSTSGTHRVTCDNQITFQLMFSWNVSC